MQTTTDFLSLANKVTNGEVPTFGATQNNAQWSKKEFNYEPITKFNYFFKDKTNKSFEKDEFPLFANEDNIVDTSVPVVHHVSGIRPETGVLYLLLREQQQSIGAATPEYVTMDSINQARLLGVDVSIKDGEKGVFYPSSTKDEFGNQTIKNIYYVNLSQLNNPEAMMDYIRAGYKEKQHERNETNRRKYESGEYTEFYEAKEEYPKFKTVDSSVTLEPNVPESLTKRYQEIEDAKLSKTVNMDEYKIQSAAIKKDIAAYMMGSIIKAGMSGVCIKMGKGDNILLKEGIQTVTNDKKAWLTKWCKQAQEVYKNLSDIEIKGKTTQTAQVASPVQSATEQKTPAPSVKPKAEKDMDYGFDIY